MKQEFEMTQEEMDDIVKINKDQMPVMKIGTVEFGMDLAEKINAYWEGLGKKYGFSPKNVEPSSKGKLFFLAEPVSIEVPEEPHISLSDRLISVTCNPEEKVCIDGSDEDRKIIQEVIRDIKKVKQIVLDDVPHTYQEKLLEVL